MGGGPPGFRQGFSCPDVLWIPLQVFRFRVQDFHFLWCDFPVTSTTVPPLRIWSTTPQCTHRGLASYPFARRYSGNRCFFLFLPLLRCFSSRRSPCITMDSSCSDCAFRSRVSPFGYLRIAGYVRLPEAFRSFLRPSSVLDAKAFTLCSY